MRSAQDGSERFARDGRARIARNGRARSARDGRARLGHFFVAGVAVLLGVCFLTACAEDVRESAPVSTAPVIAPGRPGEEARTLSPAEAATAVPSPTVNAADVRYVQDMIVHHRQALDMAALAPSHASSAKLKALAARIHDVQEPEIRVMTSWLDREHLPRPDHHADHSDMPGMATPEQMEALRAASGATFDSLFLQMMVAHHEGAITMATTALTEGSHLTVEQWATDVIAEQTAEIRRMREMQGA
ncbi:DUF305 domain-containing protein [Microbispora rosea]|uniref:DUF305 domain-containing protein n=1 Tax=Microbispora rosea TaxID=58117 RepID=UPI0036B82F0E